MLPAAPIAVSCLRDDSLCMWSRATWWLVFSLSLDVMYSHKSPPRKDELLCGTWHAQSSQDKFSPPPKLNPLIHAEKEIDPCITKSRVGSDQGQKPSAVFLTLLLACFDGLRTFRLHCTLSTHNYCSSAICCPQSLT